MKATEMNPSGFRHSKSTWMLCLLALSVADLSGCGGSGNTREMAPVSGVVTVGGETLKGGRVIFDHVEGPMAAAAIDEKGAYTTKVAIGKNKIAVDYHEEGPSKDNGKASGIRGQEIVRGKGLVPEKYAASKTSGLEFDVQKGKNVYDIALKAK